VASGPTTNRPDEAPDDALDPPNLPDFRKLAHGDFSAVDWRIFWSLLPLVVFLVLNSFWPEDLWRTQVAIVASFAASTWVFATNRCSGVIRFITVLGFIVVAGSGVAIHVIDQGPGIPRQHRERVFQPFFRLDASRSQETGGSGLGLAITRQLCQAHGWRISLRDAPGGGTDACVSIPLSIQTDTKKSPAETPLKQPSKIIVSS